MGLFNLVIRFNMCYVSISCPRWDMGGSNSEETRSSMKSETTDMRRVPRTDCGLTEVTSSRADLHVRSIDNVSTEGLLLTFEGVLAPGDELDLRVVLPDDGRTLKLSGAVVYVIDGGTEGPSVAGVRIYPGSEVFEARLRNFISAQRSSAALRDVYERYAAEHGEKSEYCVGERARIIELLEEARARTVPVNAVSQEDLGLSETQIVAVDAERGELRLTAREDHRFIQGGLAMQPTYVAFALGGGSYVFKSDSIEASEEVIRLSMPRTVYRSEKRSSQRKNLESTRSVRVYPTLAGSGTGPCAGAAGRLLDVGERGFLCEVYPEIGEESLFVEGSTVSYDLDPQFGLSDHGQIRHVTYAPVDGRRNCLQLGIEAGVARGGYSARRIEEAQWDVDPERAQRGSVNLKSLPVSYRNPSGHRISALLNATQFNVEAPVVIVPPAFGKKKETLAPFVATLLTNFARVGRDVVTLRYDGINRPGESFNEMDDPPRGYEMLRYRLRQGVSDLETTLDYVENNPYFTACAVVVFTASMSSIDARKLLAGSRRGSVDLWVSFMGVPAAQTTLSNILAGTDIVGNYRLGIPNGVRGMLGHLIDMDTLAADLIAEKYAYLTDARVDMAAVSTPLLWIVGRHDHWVDRDEVADLMSVAGANADADAAAGQGAGERELVEIPTGHNLRSSDDAIRSFMLTSEYIHRRLFGSEMTAVAPAKEDVIDLVAAERERLESPRPVAVEEYWRAYLLGSGEGSEGYDFYRNLRDFREFLRLEAELISVEDGDRVADLGCGTGLLTEVLLQRIAAAVPDAGAPGTAAAWTKAEKTEAAGRKKASLAETPPRVSVTAVDLVPDALEKTKQKCDRLFETNVGLENVEMFYLARNLEPRKGDATGFPPASFDKILASLFISYLEHPEEMMDEFYRLLAPGGRLLVSSMRPDSDVSTIFTEYVDTVRAETGVAGGDLDSAQAMLNEAATLFELEEEGLFYFYTAEELEKLFRRSGFQRIATRRSLGTPPQAIIVTGEKPAHG